MDNQIQLTALSPEILIRVLHKAGSRLITDERLQADLADGASKNADGTVNLVAYAAWLTRQRSEESTND